MKNFRLIAATMTLAVLIAVSASAQTRPGTTPARPAATPQTTAAASNAPVPETKIAFINTGAFGAEKGGITRYVNAVTMLEREFKPRSDELETMQNRIKALADEIGRLSGNSVVDPKTIQTKQDEGERLQRDLKYKDEQLKADMSKRYTDVVGPISADIGKAIDQFAAQRGITMVLDISRLAPAILSVNQAMDVTTAFITEYNSTHPATASAGTR
ncbi:MAG: outer membrane protein [Acidobacteriota bacterium]|jgi:Skp family chaperone for outer membrane proteins|nr:outer membrane protein [Acidobacteriota bacterium]